MSRVLAVFILLAGCETAQRFYFEGHDLTPRQVDEILDGVSVLYVDQVQLEGFCATAAFAECLLFSPRRVYILEDLNESQRQKARRHAASHFYDVDVLGLTVEETSRHKGW